MLKARMIRKMPVFTSGRKFSVFTPSYVNTALNQSAFRTHKCYTIKNISNKILVVNNLGDLTALKKPTWDVWTE